MLLYQQALGLEDDGSVVVETVDVLNKLVHLVDKWLYIFILEQSLAVAVVLQIVNQIVQFVLGIGDAVENEKCKFVRTKDCTTYNCCNSV